MATRRVPVVMMRGGTSRGLYFHARDLPSDPARQDEILAAVLGSPDPFGRQTNGLGGGTSSTSKAVIIEPDSTGQGDTAYTFAQVDVHTGIVDRKGNCGNLTAGVGPFALTEGLVTVDDDTRAAIRLFNTNTGKVIVAHVPLRNGGIQEAGKYKLQGVPGTGAPVQLDFLQPGGAVTGRLLPTGQPIDVVDMPSGGRIEATVVDATNPVVFVRAVDFGLSGGEKPSEIEAKSGLMDRLEMVRAVVAVQLGLVPDLESAHTHSAAHPKIALISAPRSYLATDDQQISAQQHDVLIRMLSMRRAHQSIPLTGALCTAVAAAIDGTLVHEALGPISDKHLRLGHAAGTLSVSASVRPEGNRWHADNVTVTRTARRLMEGFVLIPEG